VTKESKESRVFKVPRVKTGLLDPRDPQEVQDLKAFTDLQ